jgi:hypothetical protein
MILLLLANPRKKSIKLSKSLKNSVISQKWKSQLKNQLLSQTIKTTKFKIFGKELPQPEKYTYLGIIIKLLLILLLRAFRSRKYFKNLLTEEKEFIWTMKYQSYVQIHKIKLCSKLHKHM